MTALWSLVCSKRLNQASDTLEVARKGALNRSSPSTMEGPHLCNEAHAFHTSLLP